MIGWILSLALAGPLVAQEAGAATAAPSAEDLAAGERLFVTHCARCHGVGGGGGEGPTLQQPVLSRAGTDEELTQLIRRGVPAGGMPRNFALNDDEVRRIAGYVRSLGQVPVEPAPGDPEHGREIYQDRGCAACHILHGEGRGVGPVLDAIGAQRGLAHLRESLVEPGAKVSDDYMFVRVVAADGAKVEGLRVNEDSFTLQLRDADGVLHSFEKTALRELHKLPERSVMRSYARLPAGDLDDLVAYLATLRGGTDAQ